MVRGLCLLMVPSASQRIVKIVYLALLEAVRRTCLFVITAQIIIVNAMLLSRTAGNNMEAISRPAIIRIRII